MTTGALRPTPSAVTVPISTPRRTGPPLTRLAVRQIRRGGIAVFGIAAGMPALVAAQYQSTFAGALDGPALRALAANPAIRTLFGTPIALDDPGGFTVWRSGTPVAVLVGVWAMLVATRITRGEEDAGHWDLLLAGRVRIVDLVARCLIVLAGGLACIGLGMAAALLLAGTAPVGAMLYAAGIVGLGLVFATLGVLAAQVLPTRAAATGLSVAALGVALLMRMLADGLDRLAWLRWLTPFGLIAEAQPYAANRPAPLLVLAVPVLLGTAAAVAAARRRDVGAGMLSVPTSRRPRTRLLRSVTTFAIRRTIRPLTGWAMGITAYYLLIGLLAVSITDFLTNNVRFAKLASAAGFTELESVPGFAAAMYGLLAIPTGVYAATRIAAAAADETSRRSVPVLAQPLSRTYPVVVETGVATAGVLLLLAGAGLAVWVGTTAVGAPLGIGPALAGALNVAPIALLSLGAAVLALGWAPHLVLAIGALPAAGGFMLHIIAQSTHAPGWVDQLSPFAHLAAVPETGPEWTATAVLLVVAALLVVVGVLGYTRRDLAS